MCRTSLATSGYPFASVAVVQQSVATVKGQVVDEKGEPIIGANVIVEGTTNGMITDWTETSLCSVPQALR